MTQLVADVLSGFGCIGFSGSRSPSSASLSVLSWACAQVPAAAAVKVGCARGIDQAVRAAFPIAQVFRASEFGCGRGAFAARSTACVQAVAASSGLWVSFPAGVCPEGLMPSSKSSRCFSGLGSGSWASLAFAAGSGVACLVYLPAGLVMPASWEFTSVDGGWSQFIPPTVQASLF